ncbi:MAG: hypothetical protein KI785_15805 [Devosiaceae bacterium]|nr:hypothetical protein [Devosiaceae bacterium MH13]
MIRRPGDRPWARVNGHHYATTQPIEHDGVVHEAGLRFQVSIPPGLHWLPGVEALVHDPDWLELALKHDLDLLRPGTRDAVRAAFRFKANAKALLTRRRYLIPPAFVAVLLVPTTTRLKRRVSSWKE